MSVVVEGIETALQYDAIQQFGCEEAQGYLLGRPTPCPESFLNITPLANDLERLSAALGEGVQICALSNP
jgi:EAL domain-containing protein (putative c-di-GMP-specific phosphodiesterase class I)